MVVLLVLFTLLLTCVGAQAQGSTDERSVYEFGMLYGHPSMIHPDGDLPMLFQNRKGTQRNIETVTCYVLGGKVTLLPVFTGKGATSILKQPLPCNEGQWSGGILNGVPVMRSFAKNGTTCPNPPCTIDLNIEATEGIPGYMLVTITTRVPRAQGTRKKGR